jgi:threonine aldolase
MGIDLRSDTVTQPSETMRTAAAEAAVGDDVYGEDPTMNELEAAAADHVGMAEAVCVPTGTMGNQIAARVHTDRGQEVVLDREAHVYRWELAGLAQPSDSNRGPSTPAATCRPSSRSGRRTSRSRYIGPEPGS